MWKISASFSLLFVSAFAHAGSNNPETLTERSQERARGVLDSAVDAIGGAEALQAIQSFRLQLEGTTTPRLQMPTPEPPFTPGTIKENLVFDLEVNRVYLETR